MTSRDLFVWVYLPGATTPAVAGRLRIDVIATGASVGKFTYGESYLSRPEAVPLDPCVLPLKSTKTSFPDLSGYPGVVIDACPDRWGMHVIDRLRGEQAYPSGYLLTNDPGRAGALAFSLSPETPPAELESREFPMAALVAAASAVERGEPVDPELLKALHPGTGGARPKCNIIENGTVWIAKFPSVKDEPGLSIPRLEHATMTLARACGVRVAETRIHRVGDSDVCLVRRFDREILPSGIARRGFVSARTLFHADPKFSSVGTGSYARLARWLGRYGVPLTCRAEVYRRMVFNVAVRNTDDHELNHGLVQKGDGFFDLAPAYDILPNRKAGPVGGHALIIGDTAWGTIENLLGNTEAFGLDQGAARTIVEEVIATVNATWQDIFYDCGFGDEELRKLEPCFARPPISAGPRRTQSPR